MATKQQLEAQNPLILRCNRIMDAFAKSDDERDFYLDRQEGFIIYVDLDKPEEELRTLEKELQRHPERYCLIPKLTFYEAKKIMEGFINEKVYDIDTKEKLLDIIQSKEARENFLEFIYDHHSELEKWQTFYQERSRIRIIEWLRANNFHFVFEEDLELPRMLLEKLKRELFQPRVGKDIQNARKALFTKAKTYYSSEALNPRPKRGRPPKQIQKAEIEPTITTDIYTTVPNGLRGFLFTPDLSSMSSATFSTRFGNEGDLFTSRRPASAEGNISIETLNQKLEAIRSLSSRWKEVDLVDKVKHVHSKPPSDKPSFVDQDEEEEDFEEVLVTKAPINGQKIQKKIEVKTPQPKSALQKPTPLKKTKPPAKPAPRRLIRQSKTRIMPKKKTAARPLVKSAAKSKPVAKAKPKAKAPVKKVLKKAPLKKANNLRPLKKVAPKKKK